MGTLLLAAQGLRADFITDWTSLAVYSDSNVSVGWHGSVGGSMAAGGLMAIGDQATVQGDLYAGGAITTGWKSTFGAAYDHLGSGPFKDIGVPVFNADASGGDAVQAASKETLSLAPGTYGDVSTAWRGHLQLVAGTYIFDSLTLGDESTIALDTSGGDVLIFVAGDANLAWKTAIAREGDGGALLSVGGAFTGGTEGVWDTSLLAGGPAVVGWNSRVTGQLFAGGDVLLDTQAVVEGVSQTSVPEPVAAVCLLLGATLLIRRR
jgi:hypothetical protein